MKPNDKESMSTCQFPSNIGQRPQSRLNTTAIGLNDNLEFMGQQLHVQTEKMETPTNCIMTQVFCNGRVVLSKKFDFSVDFSNSFDFNAIQNLMRAQHSKIIQDIMRKKTEVLGASHRSTTL